MKYDSHIGDTIGVLSSAVHAIAGCEGLPPAVSPGDGSSHLGERSSVETTFHNKKARLEIQCTVDVKRHLKASKLF